MNPGSKQERAEISISRRALDLHSAYKGKVQILPKCPIGSTNDFALWYTPGVASPCKAIQENPDRVYEYTNKGNVVAIVSNGSRVLGLGNIGPEAGLPVMEGKALLFKYLGGVDAFPLCIRAKDNEEIIRFVEAISPSLGASTSKTYASRHAFVCFERLEIASTFRYGMTINKEPLLQCWRA
jgi:malate dehydrogenase (oxaloacetate-decarboxylating)